MGDGLAGLRRIMTGVLAAIVLREMPQVSPFDVEQLGIPLLMTTARASGGSRRRRSVRTRRTISAYSTRPLTRATAA